MCDENKTISIVHPGITLTNITAHYPKIIFAIIKHPMKLIFMSPQKASLCIVFGLFNECNQNEWIGPKFFNVWGLPNKKLLKTAHKNETEQITKISNNILEKTL